jgi:hypothetical protein
MAFMYSVRVEPVVMVVLLMAPTVTVVTATLVVMVATQPQIIAVRLRPMVVALMAFMRSVRVRRAARVAQAEAS